MRDDAYEIFTIGHSARPLDEFIALLAAHGVTQVVDVRRVPRVRLVPQFDRNSLPIALGAAGVSYTHAPELGGLSGARNGSPRRCLDSAALGRLPDYMQPQFAAAIDMLVSFAGGARIAIMCLEALPRCCYRSLIADALTVRGLAVGHIVNATLSQPHVLTPWAWSRARAWNTPVVRRQRGGRMGFS